MTKLIRIADDTSMNHVLGLLKFVPGSKTLIADCIRITGVASPVIIKSFKELGLDVGVRKLTINGVCLQSLLNVEPIDATVPLKGYVKKDPKAKKVAPVNESELMVTSLAESDYGQMELMLFTVHYGGFYSYSKKYSDDARGRTGWWYVIQDTYGRRFVTVRPDMWKSDKVDLKISSPEWYYGRVKISDNKTKIEPGSRYINVYECAIEDSGVARAIETNYKEKYTLLDK